MKPNKSLPVKILLILLFLSASLALPAQQYKVIEVKGRCEYQQAKNDWAKLQRSHQLTDKSMLRTGNEEVKLTLATQGEESKGAWVTLRPNKKGTLEDLSRKKSLVISFIEFFVPSKRATLLSGKADPAFAQTYKSIFDTNDIFASLFAKTGGKFAPDSLTADLSDIALTMQITPGTPGKRNVTIYNYTPDTLYTLLLIMPVEEQHTITVEPVFKSEQLIRVDSLSHTDFTIEARYTTCRYLLLAATRRFHSEELINKINACTPGMEIPSAENAAPLGIVTINISQP